MSWRKCDKEWVNFDHLRIISVENSLIEKKVKWWICALTKQNKSHALFERYFDTEEEAGAFLQEFMNGQIQK
jgi:hypothetical protein